MKKFVVCSILGVLLISLGVYSCGGNGNNVTDSDTTKPPVVVEDEDIPPTTLKVFIDASGSMRDYFGKEDIQNITDALSGAKQAVETLDAEYYVWGDTVHKIASSELTDKLIDKNLRGKASTFDKIFEEMTQMAGKDTLTMLLSDGIISSTPLQTKKSESFTDYDKGNLTNAIQKALKSKGKAVSIYRMKGNFNGNYLNKGNKPVPYQGERPFFIFVLGEPENVRYFDLKVRNGEIEEVYKDAEAIYIGTAPKMNFLIEPADGKDDMASAEDFEREEGTKEYKYTGTQGFRIKAEIPKWIKDSYSNSMIKDMSVIEIDGKPQNNIKVTIDDNYMIFDISEKIVEGLQDRQKKWTIRYIMTDPALKGWEKYSTDDDTTPDAEKTYLLIDLIQAIHKGVTGGQSSLLEAEITIIPQ
ncbi:MAG: ABC transporter permease [Muribaculaceae bacterium]|nr:ABC transporter permease [Muribaculaceae bacterium]